MQLNALLLTFFRQLLNNVTLEGSSIHDVVIRFLGVKHRETIVMSACDGDVLGTRSLDLRHPLRSIKLRRIEARSQFGILVAMNVTVIHIPFATGGHAIDAPMKEDTELVVLKLLASLQVLGRRSISLCIRGRNGT